MNTENQTIVSGEMMQKMREAGVDQGYEPVPQKLEKKAKKLLGRRDIVSMNKRFRYLAKKAKVKAGNRKHETAVKEARERLVAQGLL